MSALDPHDRYYTPAPLADAVLRWVEEVYPPFSGHQPGERPGALIEPCTGGGAFSLAARRLYSPAPVVAGCDVDHDSPAIARGDARLASVDDPEWLETTARIISSIAHSALIATNPPYSILELVLLCLFHLQARLSLASCPAPIVLLLRETALSHLCDSDTPPDVIGLCPIRPAFEGPAGDKLLEAAQRKAAIRIEETRACHLAEARKELAEAESSIEIAKALGWGPSIQQTAEIRRTKAQVRISRLMSTPLRPASVESYGSDSCGSALALWYPITPGLARPPRSWHPVPRWRAKGARS